MSEDDFQQAGQRLFCRRCRERIDRSDTLCVICDSTNPWRPRDTIHYWCRVCGNTQSLTSHLITA